MIQCNASLNIQDSLGNTPLIYACIADNCESIKLLLGSRADVHIRNNDGLSALEVSAKVKKSVPAVEIFALNDMTLNRGIPPVHWRTFFNTLGDPTKNFFADVEREGSSLFPLGFSATQPMANHHVQAFSTRTCSVLGIFSAQEALDALIKYRKRVDNYVQYSAYLELAHCEKIQHFVGIVSNR